MTKVLICGGSGFIGSHLSKTFRDDEDEVTVFDSNIQYFYPSSKYTIQNTKDKYERLLEGVKIIRGSTEDANDLRRVIFQNEPEIIVNLAALPLAVTAVNNSEEAFKSICYSTHNIMEVLRDYPDLKTYTHISSSMVYGDFESDPNPETASKDPKEIYGSMKLASEFIVSGYSKRYNINSRIVRPSAVYGPGDNNRRVLQKFCEAALQGEKISAINPSTNLLDFSYVEDTAMGIKLVSKGEADPCSAFNITRGEGRSLDEVLKILKGLFPSLKVSIYEESSSIYPKRGALDISKARDLFGYCPKTSIEQGLVKYIEYLSRA